MPFMARNAVFRKLAEIADVNTLTQEEHEKYDSSIKVLRDNIAVYQGAMQKGRAEGRVEGRVEGREEGREEGRVEEKLSIARTMKSDGLPIETIIKYTGLSADEISSL